MLLVALQPSNTEPVISTQVAPTKGPDVIAAAIAQVAQTLGVDPNLAIATAIKESNLNPKASGDGGNSVGAFQLNFAGGEGTASGLTKTEATNPSVNAQVALTNFVSAQKQYPGASPGAIAFLAQKPFGYQPGMSLAQVEQQPYTQQVNSIYGQLRAGADPASLTVGAVGPQGPQAPPGTSAAGTSTSGGCGAKGNLFTFPIVGGGLTYCNLKAITGGAIMVGGAVVMLVGTILIFKSSIKLPGLAGIAQGYIGGKVAERHAPQPSTGRSASEEAAGRRLRKLNDLAAESQRARAVGDRNAREAGPFPDEA